MTREQALELVRQRVKNGNLVKHMIAAGAAMKFLAPKLKGDAIKWELAGILHDIDYDQTVDDFGMHGMLSYKMLQELGIDDSICSAVRAHPAHEQHPPQTPMEWALHIVDPLTGLIVAAALMHSTKKIAHIDTEFILRRFKEKRFAAGANRDQILLCENKLSIPLEEFVGIVLKSMQSVSTEIGL